MAGARRSWQDKGFQREKAPGHGVAIRREGCDSM